MFRNRLRITLFILIFLIFCSQVLYASEYGVFYEIKKNEEVSSPNLAGLHIEQRLGDKFLFTARGLTGDLISQADYRQLAVDFYKKLPVSSEFDYYLGPGYSYLADGRAGLTSNLLAIKLKGINDRKRYSVSTVVGYAPFGTYSRTGGETENMTAWQIDLRVKVTMLEPLYLSLAGSMEDENFGDFSSRGYSYRIGMGWEL